MGYSSQCCKEPEMMECSEQSVSSISQMLREQMFFFFFFNNFIYLLFLFLAVLVLCCCAGFSLVVESGSSSPVAVLGFLLQWLLLLRAQALGSVGSVVAA